MKIVVFGAGVQGTLYGVRLAAAGHDVTLVARGDRAKELRDKGAVIQDAMTGRTNLMNLPVVETLLANTTADLGLVFVRREQISQALPALTAAVNVQRFVFMFNHANGSEFLFHAIGRKRVVLGFPGAGGSIEEGVDRYVDIPEQGTVIQSAAPEVASILRHAGFPTKLVADMDAWLKRHAVMITAIGGAICEKDGNARVVSADANLVRTIVLAVREGWGALDKQHVTPASLALRTIFQWVPLPFAVLYWRRLIGSARGDYYFARHTRHAAAEMKAIASDIHKILAVNEMPALGRLYAALEKPVGQVG
jgi:2-dehydropantoate 2-reductase